MTFPKDLTTGYKIVSMVKMLLKIPQQTYKRTFEYNLFVNWMGLAGLKRPTLLFSSKVWPCTKKAKSFIVTDKPHTPSLNKDKDWLPVGEPV